MAGTFLDMLQAYNGQTDKDVNVGAQTLVTGVPLVSGWSRTIDMNAVCKRPSTLGPHAGFVKYIAPAEDAVVVNLEKSVLKLEGTGVDARIAFKGFRFVNGRVWINCRNVWEWYSNHYWSWEDWGLLSILQKKVAFVNLASNGNVTRISGDAFNSADLYDNTRLKGFVRIFGGGTADGWEANNVLFGRLDSVTDSSHAHVLSVADTPQAGSNLLMEWGQNPEGTGASTPRTVDVSQSNGWHSLGGHLYGGSTTIVGEDAKNFLCEGFLMDDARNPRDDLYIPGITHLGGNTDAHNESIAAYGGLQGAYRRGRFKGSLQGAPGPGQNQSVRPIIKTAVQTSKPNNPFDVTLETIDLVDPPNNAVLQLNDNSAAPYAQSKARIGDIRIFATGGTPVPSGALLYSNVNGVEKYDESILTQDSSRVLLTKLTNPMAQYRIANPGNGNYRDQQWRAAWGYNEEDAYWNWGTVAPVTWSGGTGPPPPPPPPPPTGFGDADVVAGSFIGGVSPTSPGATVTKTTPAAATYGKRLWMVVAGGTDGATITVDASWSLEVSLDGGGVLGGAVYSQLIGVGGAAASYTATVSAGAPTMCMFVTGNDNNAAHLDAAIVTSKSSAHSPAVPAGNNYTTPAITASQKGDADIRIICTDNTGQPGVSFGGASGTPAGFTLLGEAVPDSTNSRCGIAVFYKELGLAIGAQSAQTHVGSAGQEWIGVSILVAPNPAPPEISLPTTAAIAAELGNDIVAISSSKPTTATVELDSAFNPGFFYEDTTPTPPDPDPNPPPKPPGPEVLLVAERIGPEPETLVPQFVDAPGQGTKLRGGNSVFFVVRNTSSTAPTTVTIDDPHNYPNPGGTAPYNPDLVTVVPAGQERWMGPLPSKRFARSDGFIHIAYSRWTGVRVAAFIA